jgi:hypothetical protein
MTAAMLMRKKHRRFRTILYKLLARQPPTKQHDCNGRDVVIAASRVSRRVLDAHSRWTGSVLSWMELETKVCCNFGVTSGNYLHQPGLQKTPPEI